ncbi:integrase [Salipiger aestuarii]|nr:integrase [Salipiger aestuarii]
MSNADLKLMRRIDKLHMEFPFAGSRMLRGLLVQEGFKVRRLQVATLMKGMGIKALYRKPNTSKPAPGHKIYPYLLRKPPIIRPNQVWAMDITCIPPLGRFSVQIACRAMDGARVHLPRRRSGLVHPPRPGLARVDHAGSGFLH